MAGDEDEIAVLRAALAPLQVVRRMHRLAVLVRAEEADVEVVARILEVVGIAAEEGDADFRREDEPDVGVFLVAIEVVLAALEERDHVAAEAASSARDSCSIALITPRRAACAAAVVMPGVTDGVDARGDVLDRLQNVQLEVDALHFVGLRLRVVAGRDVVVVLGGDLGQAVQPDVMVRQRQTVGGDERAGAAAVESDRRLLQMIEPRLRRLEVVTLLEDCVRRSG